MIIFTIMTIRLDMKSPKYPYKLNIIIFEDVGPTSNRAASVWGRKVWKGAHVEEEEGLNFILTNKLF